MQTKKRNKSQIIFGSLFIFIGLAIPLFSYLHDNLIEKKENENIEKFFINKPNKTNEENVKTKSTKSDLSDYIAIIEIPTLSLKRGLVSKDSKNNNINKNIQILKESDMPDVRNGNVILASHSGNTRVSFFKNLNLLKINDISYIYYNNIKYTYKVTKKYLEKKDGDIQIHKDKDTTTLTLTTCSPNHNDKQLTVISELISQEEY